jgi:hypothetical protein
MHGCRPESIAHFEYEAQSECNEHCFIKIYLSSSSYSNFIYHYKLFILIMRLFVCCKLKVAREEKQQHTRKEKQQHTKIPVLALLGSLQRCFICLLV